jgi:hypothetical protein
MSNLFHQTMVNLERSLTCELIASEIDLVQGIKAIATPDQEILAYASQHRFSHVPLRDEKVWGEKVGRRTAITHVAIVDLKQSCVLDRWQITLDDVIAGETPLSKAVEILQDKGFCLVLVQDSLRKILTRSDLNKLPVRVYLVALLAHLEGLLADMIDAVFPNNSWIELLKEHPHKARIKGLFEKKKAEEFDARLIDCTTLSDKSTIIQNSAEFLEKIAPPSRNQLRQQVRRISVLRDRLAHGLTPLTEDSDTFRDHLFHAQGLTKGRDVKWLAGTILTIQTWIDCLTQPEE